MAVHLIRLDDRDPTISYSANTWGQAGNGNEYLHTTTRSNRVGAFMKIPFNAIHNCKNEVDLPRSTAKGTKIVLYGTVDSSVIGTLPHSLITVDDSRGYDFVGPQNSEIQYQQKFWESSDLPPGPHLLTVSITSGSTNRAAFSFDYAEYYPLDLSSTGSNSSSSSITLPTNTPTPSSSHSSHSKSSTPIIAGAICGVVVFIAIVLGVIFCIRKRRRTKDPETNQWPFRRGASPSGDRSVTPFITHSRNPSNQFMASNNELNSSSVMSEYRSVTAGGATQTSSVQHDTKSITVGGEASQPNNVPPVSGGGRSNPPPRYESYRFPIVPAVTSEP
ncbi:LOW QUALITY PROTEIN: hypothetical protein CVT25_003574 [Psilocybe cyanescens]|uniref:Uncharacterized protein n=1 Tax=Psilocybe cyanescens TaxID=93625 RepID=A0A409WNZ4_PSICY|nr:LOW QUALITY PROTEIN: hypothetical protein CVT25_003574 [Psilocybe cyanescens]